MNRGRACGSSWSSATSTPPSPPSTRHIASASRNRRGVSPGRSALNAQHLPACSRTPPTRSGRRAPAPSGRPRARAASTTSPSRPSTRTSVRSPRRQHRRHRRRPRRRRRSAADWMAPVARPVTQVDGGDRPPRGIRDPCRVAAHRGGHRAARRPRRGAPTARRVPASIRVSVPPDAPVTTTHRPSGGESTGSPPTLSRLRTARPARSRARRPRRSWPPTPHLRRARHRSRPRSVSTAPKTRRVSVSTGITEPRALSAIQSASAPTASREGDPPVRIPRPGLTAGGRVDRPDRVRVGRRDPDLVTGRRDARWRSRHADRDGGRVLAAREAEHDRGGSGEQYHRRKRGEGMTLLDAERRADRGGRPGLGCDAVVLRDGSHHGIWGRLAPPR